MSAKIRLKKKSGKGNKHKCYLRYTKIRTKHRKNKKFCIFFFIKLGSPKHNKIIRNL